MQTFDIVVVGGGSNSLTAAAYLAKAGKSVLVLEKNDQCGGGVVSTEIAPGFIHDPHAGGFYGCVSNPTLSVDELGLKSKHGLELIEYDISFSTVFDDGATIIAYSDLDKSCEEIAKFSEKDAETFRDFVMEARTFLPLLNRGAFTPPLPMSKFIGLLETSVVGRRLLENLFVSCFDLIDRKFESEHVKIHMFKWCAEGMECPEMKGTGMLLYNLLALAFDINPVVAKGGAYGLTASIIRAIEAHGGTVRTGAQVTKIKVSGGRANGVFVGDEFIAAKDAVIGSIHPWMLGEIIPAIDEDIAASARRTFLSGYGAITQQIALEKAPEYAAGPEFAQSMGCEFVEVGLEGVRRFYDELRYGHIPKSHLSPLAIQANAKDPTRAPEGKYSLYLYHFAPMVLADGGLGGWEDQRQSYGDAIWETYKKYCTNIDDSDIIARQIECPLDHHNHSASMINGDIIGIGTQLGQLLGRRPTPELAQYNVPGIEGLYLAGPFMHPGGTVLLGGRATAIKIYKDLGIELTSGFEGI